MAMMDTNGLAEFYVSMEELEDLPDELLDEMLHAEADIIEPAQKAKGLAYGVHLTGVTLNAIKRGKPRKRFKKDGRELYVYPEGENDDGNRNAEVAFINEFGKHGQAPRPFIRDANEESADEAAQAAEKVYNTWLASKGF